MPAGNPYFPVRRKSPAGWQTSRCAVQRCVPPSMEGTSRALQSRQPWGDDVHPSRILPRIAISSRTVCSAWKEWMIRRCSWSGSERRACVPPGPQPCRLCLCSAPSPLRVQTHRGRRKKAIIPIVLKKVRIYKGNGPVPVRGLIRDLFRLIQKKGG